MVKNLPSQRRAKAQFSSPKPDVDKLPPHSEEAERAALGCVLFNLLVEKEQHGQVQQEQDELLAQLRPGLFYMVNHGVILRAMIQLRFDQHALNVVTLCQWLKDQKLLEQAGGFEYVSTLPDATPSIFAFPTYLATLKDKALRRWTLQRQVRLTDLAHAENLTVEMLQAEFAEIHERAEQIGAGKVPYIRVITPKQAREFVPDPTDSMIGEGLIDRGMVVTIGGKPGIGKSRLLTTLAVAGARGHNNWMNYPVRCKWRSLLLQSENSGKRLSEEYNCVPVAYDDDIRVSDLLAYGLAFDKPEFRRELRAIYDKWPFTMLGIDPWNDVTSEEGQADYKLSLQNIKSVFFGLPKPPLIVIVAHLRKAGRDSNGKPKSGREILEELSGSLALGSESRTVFSVQAVTPSMDDPRVVFDIAKANDCNPAWLKEHGTRSGWVRANAAFEPIQIDWEQYDNPGEPERRKVTDEMLKAVFEGQPLMKPAQISKKLKALFEIGESTAFRAIGEDGYLRGMLQRNGLGQLQLKEAK